MEISEEVVVVEEVIEYLFAKRYVAPPLPLRMYV